LPEGPGLVLGRAAPADLCLDDKSLSRRHARFSLLRGLVHVEDLGSTNGVCLDGELVSEAMLEDGDVVALGAVRVTVSGLVPLDRPQQVRGFATFREGGRAEIDRAYLLGRSFSLLALRVKDAASGSLSRVPSLLRSIDLFTEDTPDLALVLLPETPVTLGLELGRGIVERAAEPMACAVVAYPEDASDMESLIERAVHQARTLALGTTERVTAREQPRDAKAPVIAAPSMQRLYALIDRIARTTLSVLVLGETGAGKELASRAVHERSTRASGPFVAINCASIPQNLVESVLFGHERGAFTGASEKRAGVFEQAHGGSVFLDEVGELSASVQAALLRVLETKEITRVGSTKEIDVDVRIIAATHRDLATMVAAGTFREDLMFRLDALSVRVPPLRERVEEIEPLAVRFLEQARSEWGALPRSFDGDALAALRRYAWPGNVRQLKNVVERAAVVCPRELVMLEDLPDALLQASDPASAPDAVDSRQDLAQSSAESDPTAPLDMRVRAFEARLIREALAKHDGNQARAAGALGLPRRTLSHKIAALKGA